MHEIEGIESSSFAAELRIERIPVFSESECERIRTKVHDLRQLWIVRHPLVPFYTLGAASYLDGGFLMKYLELARKFNDILREEFAWMYTKLFEALENQLRGPVVHAEKFAVPGFHVLLSHEAFENSFAHFHFDLQYEFLYRNNESADFSKPFSFTLAIAIPKSGASMTMCDLRESEVKDFPLATILEASKGRKQSIVPYEHGTMVTHDGHYLHKLSPIPKMEPEDERITLQGHAICCDGNWQIYW